MTVADVGFHGRFRVQSGHYLFALQMSNSDKANVVGLAAADKNDSNDHRASSEIRR